MAHRFEGVAAAGFRLRVLVGLAAIAGLMLQPPAPAAGQLPSLLPKLLAAHNPSILARREARLLRQLGTRFYLSCGSTADHRTAALAIAFARELDALRLPHELYLRPGAHNGHFWLAQFPEALRYALPADGPPVSERA